MSLFALLASGITLSGVAAVVALVHWCSRIAGRRSRHLALAFLLSYMAVLVVRPAAWPVIDLAVLVGAAGAVLLLEGGLVSPPAVVAFLCVAATVDVLSMSGGLSRLLIERYRDGTSQLLLYLTLVAPVRGRPVPIVGIGDLLVAGMAATALIRLRLRAVAVMGSIASGLLAALAYGLWRGGAPAVPFIATAVLVLVWRHSLRGSRRAASSGPLGTDSCAGGL